MTTKTYGAMTEKPVDIDATEITQERRELARLRANPRYVPDSFFWRKAIRSARTLADLREIASDLLGEVELQRRDMVNAGFVPSKGIWAPGEEACRPQMTHLSWADENGYLRHPATA